ncbi:MAG TPA: VOC family protein [Methanoregulaceae archaeon]|nr:VOC family protein [Methanoregulaceae archaeon]HQJ88810.1 VOC family protein [Methanoregulaceae archaeon]
MIRYNSVVLFSEDVPRLRDFYRDLFGLEVGLDLGGMVSFVCGISIWEMDDVREMVYGGVGPSTVERPRQECYFETDEIEGFVQRLGEGVRLAHPLKTAPWQQRVIRFYDPEGNLVEVGEAMDAVVRRLASEGRSPDEIAALTLMPSAFVDVALGGGAHA